MKRAATLFLFLACLVCVAHARPSVVPEISSPITSMKASGLVDASLDGASPTARTIGLPLSRREVHNKKVNTCTTYAHKRYDAADATREGGATVRNDDDHGDFTGNGYVNLMADTGDSITWTIPYGSVCSSMVTLKFRYAGPAIEVEGRWPLKLEVDGKIVEDSLSFRTTGTWQKWRFVTVHTQLLCAQDVPGTCSDNKVKLTTIGSSGANFDKLVVVATIGPTDFFVNEDNTVNTCKSYAHKRYDAADATLQGKAEVRNDDEHGGFTGNGYVNLMAVTGDSITWIIPHGSVCSHTVALKFRYALLHDDDDDRSLKLEVNGKIVEDSLSFPKTGSWKKWRFVTVLDVVLRRGKNKVKLTTIGSSGANFDRLAVVATIAPTAAQLAFVTVERDSVRNERDSARNERDSALTNLLACQNEQQNEKTVCDASLKSCNDGCNSRIQGAVQNFLQMFQGCMAERHAEKAVCDAALEQKQNEKTVCDAALKLCEDGIDSAVQNAVQQCQGARARFEMLLGDCESEKVVCDSDLGMYQNDKEVCDSDLGICQDDKRLDKEVCDSDLSVCRNDYDVCYADLASCSPP